MFKSAQDVKKINVFELSSDRGKQDFDYKDMIDDLKIPETSRVTIGKIYDKTNDILGLALALSLLSMIVILPIGAVPGIPAVCGVIMLLMCLNALISQIDIKLPRVIAKKKVSGKTIHKTCGSLEKFFARVEKISEKDRMELFFSALFVRLSMIATIILALGMIFFGYIPLLPTLFMVPVMLFSIAILMKDGLFMLIGLILFFVMISGATTIVMGFV